EAVDRVVLLEVVDRRLVATPVELVAPVLEAVGPGDQHLPAARPRHLVGAVAVENRASVGRVRPQPASHLDDDHALVAIRDLDLLAGRRGHRAPDPGSAIGGELDRRPATTNDQANIARATIAASA